jgi:hypothetical protein
MSNWELCPKCMGSKVEYTDIQLNNYIPCDICDGKGIISSLTGLPPKSSTTPQDVFVNTSFPTREEIENEIVPKLKGLFKDKVNILNVKTFG